MDEMTELKWITVRIGQRLFPFQGLHHLITGGSCGLWITSCVAACSGSR